MNYMLSSRTWSEEPDVKQIPEAPVMAHNYAEILQVCQDMSLEKVSTVAEAGEKPGDWIVSTYTAADNKLLHTYRWKES